MCSSKEGSRDRGMSLIWFPATGKEGVQGGEGAKDNGFQGPEWKEGVNGSGPGGVQDLSLGPWTR